MEAVEAVQKLVWEQVMEGLDISSVGEEAVISMVVQEVHGEAEVEVEVVWVMVVMVVNMVEVEDVAEEDVVEMVELMEEVVEGIY